MPLKNKIEIASHEGDLVLRSISSEDIESLREWKNKNRKSFFYNKIITPGQQKKWYEDYSKRSDDYIFIINFMSSAIGCIGFRLSDGLIDIYNVILGKKEFGGRGLMGNALRLLCSYIIDSFKEDITLNVLSNNKAKNWYKNNGFMEAGSRDDFIFMKLSINKFKNLKYNFKDM
jgi:RimJ/RimL family protein N-acetyltransferase